MGPASCVSPCYRPPFHCETVCTHVCKNHWKYCAPRQRNSQFGERCSQGPSGTIDVNPMLLRACLPHSRLKNKEEPITTVITEPESVIESIISTPNPASSASYCYPTIFALSLRWSSERHSQQANNVSKMDAQINDAFTAPNS